MNEYFSGTRPDLISMKSLNDLAPFIQNSDNFNMIAGNNNFGKTTIKTNNNLTNFYEYYIRPNILPIIIIIIFVGCIIIRYLSVNDNPKNNKCTPLNKEDDTLNSNVQKSHIENFNPAKPVFSQKNHNVYVEPPKVELEKTQILYDLDDDLFNKIIDPTVEPSINLDNVPYIVPSVSDPLEYREQIQNSKNEWANQSEGLPNPFYGNNYISSTADAINFTRYLDKQNMNFP
jgi:hypothetical protein